MKKNFILVTTMLTVCLSLTGCHMKHEWQEATCTQPRTCTIGGETEGQPLGHTWIDATCTESKTCSVCGETEGQPLGHTWIDATCTEPKTCSVCGETNGEPIEHDVIYTTGKCRVCNQQIIEVEDIKAGDIENYFDIAYTSTAESPCTISVEPKDGGYKYSSGYISLKIYQGEKRRTEVQQNMPIHCEKLHLLTLMKTDMAQLK